MNGPKKRKKPEIWRWELLEQDGDVDLLIFAVGFCGKSFLAYAGNRDRQSDDPSHHLFFVEAPDRRQGGQERAQERGEGQRAAETPRTPQTPSAAPHGGFQGHGQGQRVPDHQAPLDHDDAPEWAQ
jgi:hypothetical protein